MAATDNIENSLGTFASDADELAYLRNRVAALEADKINLIQQLDYWKKRFFGRMSEKRHLPIDPSQLSLFSAEELSQMTLEEKQQLQEEVKKQEEAVTKSVTVRKQPKRRRLDTSGLLIVEKHLYPEGTTDTKGNLLDRYVEIGTENSDRLEMVAPKLYVERTIRHKVVAREQMKLNPEERHILNATVGDWYEKAVESLNVLFKLLRRQVMISVYIQIDESIIPVIDNEKHKTRKGYLWCVRDGLTGAVYFLYVLGSRSKKAAREIGFGKKELAFLHQ